jgi:hypothetical protein
MPLQYHFVSEAERWANLSYKLATMMSPVVKNTIQTSQLKASQPMPTTIPHMLFTNTSNVLLLVPASKQFSNTTSRALHTMTEATPQIFRLHEEPVKRMCRTSETLSEFLRIQHALREARWEAVGKEGQRMKVERAMKAVALEVEARNSGSGMFCSLW